MDACLFTFHHLRFLCHDIPNTIDFYQTLGLSVYSKTDSVTHNAQGQMVTKTTIIFTYPQKTKPFYLIFEYLPSHSAFEANNIQKEMIVLAERPFLDPSNEYLVFYVQHIEKITKLLAAKSNHSSCLTV
jgi:catechol 2,3-dioxygenase-like lactoylglutathione lyase family enzyme